MSAPDVVVAEFDVSAQSTIHELERRDLTCSTNHNPWPNSAKALVVLAGTRRVGSVHEFLEGTWRSVIDAGAGIVVAVPNVEISVYQRLASSLASLPLSCTGRLEASRIVVSRNEPATVANAVASMNRHRPSNEQLAITPASVAQAEQVLLRRSFGDCREVALQSLVPGKTARVYRVDATKLSGERPLPFFVKIGARQKIADEYDNFVTSVRDYVSFSARPNLIDERCLVGADDGILVGQLIEESEAFDDAVLRGSPVSIVHAVFDNVLKGWWRRGDRAIEASDRSAVSLMAGWFRPSSDARRRCLSEFHATAGLAALKPDEIADRLDARPAQRHWQSLIHGDLHCGNIHVKGNEVFLIDFGSIFQGPILADPAMLEASLVVQAGIRSVQSGERPKWSKCLGNALYRTGWEEQHHTPDFPSAETKCLQRLCSAVRAVRMHAFNNEQSKGDYRALLAAAYMRIACFNDPDPAERKTVVSELYAVASGLVL